MTVNGQEVCYLEHRLQNNVFDGKGVLWRMFKVEGVGLYANVDGTSLYSTGNPDKIERRDLKAQPFTTGDEVFNYVDDLNPNGLIVEDLGVAFNCPIVPADGHPVMDLNP